MMRDEKLVGDRSNQGAVAKRVGILLVALMVALGGLLGLPQEVQAAELIGCPGGGFGRSMFPLWSCYGGCAGGREDDGSYLVPLSDVAKVFPDGVPFLTTFANFYININGNISFGEAVPTFTPDAIPGLSIPTIAAWYADVDFSGLGSDVGDAYLCIDEERQRLIVTWDRVGFFSSNVSKRNSFQIILSNVTDGCSGAENFEVEYRYGRLEWTTGNASGGSGGLGGSWAVAGIDAGDTVNALPLPFSGTSSIRDLINESNVDSPGVFKFIVVEGTLPTCGNGSIEMCEECDDGDDDNHDECTNLCQNNGCGDGFVKDGIEECDRSQFAPGEGICPLGYEGTPLCNNHFGNEEGDGTCTFSPLPPGCTNVDECASSLLNNCSADAICSDNVGAYDCACLDGYLGDGFNCEDVDECADEALHDCPDFTQCRNLPGTYLCECSPGYASFQGRACEEVDECLLSALNDCNENATCINTEGSYDCECEEGYDGDGFNCLDIDECLDPALNSCADEAVCVNTFGTYECFCRGFYEGDGSTCELRCGNGVIDSGEDCDPNITDPENFWYVENCRLNCTYCGDAFVSDGEDCDDGDAEGGDGCSESCIVEEGWDCSQGSPSSCRRVLVLDDVEDPNPTEDVGTPGDSVDPDDCGCSSVRKDTGGGSKAPWIVAFGLLMGLAGFRRRS